MISDRLSVTATLANTASNANQSANRLSSAIIQRGGEKSKENVVPALDDPSLATPEKVNSVANQAQLAVNNEKVVQQAEQDAKRNVAVSLTAYQNQQNAIDAYVTAATGESQESTEFNLQDLADLRQRNNQLEKLFEERPRDNIPSIQPEPDPELETESQQVSQLQIEQIAQPLQSQQRLEASIENAVGAGGQSNSFDIRV